MPDPRRYIGVRISEQGHRYIQLVADRDNTNYSAALRHLLAMGVRTDMEAHIGSERTDDRAGLSDPAGRDGQSDRSGGSRDSDSGAGSGTVPRVPDRGVGDAIGALVRAGLNPASISEEDDGPSAA